MLPIYNYTFHQSNILNPILKEGVEEGRGGGDEEEGQGVWTRWWDVGSLLAY